MDLIQIRFQMSEHYPIYEDYDIYFYEWRFATANRFFTKFESP